MVKNKLTDAEKEQKFAQEQPVMFGLIMARLAWGWNNLDDWQRKVLASDDRYILLNCSRQSGKSSILAIKAFHLALTYRDALVLIIAEQRQSNEDMRKVKQLAKAYDSYLMQKYDGHLRCFPATDKITELELSNGSRIVALPANEKVRGYSAPTAVIIDEASYLPDEVFVAVDPMMTVSKGQFILASTPNGTTGFYYTEAKNPRYKKIGRDLGDGNIGVPWWECPRISREEIEQKRLIYGEAYVKQEYECAFLDDVSALFMERELRESIVDEDVLADEMSAIKLVLTGE